MGKLDVQYPEEPLSIQAEELIEKPGEKFTEKFQAPNEPFILENLPENLLIAIRLETS